MSLGEQARARPDELALISLPRRLTYGELNDRQRALAGWLGGIGLEPGARVAVHSANRVELLEATIGALRAGLVPVPIHHLLTRPEATYLIEDSGARVVLSDRPVEAVGDVERVVIFGDAYERLLHDASPVDIADVTLTRPMHYTSGTTGSPKGVWVPPRTERDALASSVDFRSYWGIEGDDVHLVCSPLTHSAPHRYATRTLEGGGAVVIQERFDAEETLAAIDLFSATTTFMVPTHLERILLLEDRELRRYSRASIKYLWHAGSPIREETKRRAIELYPADSIVEFYGSTEGHFTRITTREWLERPGSVGRPRDGTDIVILDESHKPLPNGEVGEVWLSGAERFEYWRDRRKTAAAWHGNAFSVGDLGWVDDDGYLFLTGRKDDTIISGGVNVYPAEVEQVLMSHPSVAEALVGAEPHPEWGEQVVAKVVPAFGQPLDPEKLRAWARERLAGFKCPRRIDLVDELPRTPTGKLKRT